ncbi:hypothetical protein FHR71_004806 [Methylobacterium sp. RAS18]|nr:hypothetical protein [Methylobacterium sp. RAS18]
MRSCLFTLARLRIGCLALGIVRLSGGPQGIAADFHPDRQAPVIPVSDEITVRDRRIVICGGCDDAVERVARAAVFLRRLQDARDRRG